MEEFDKKPAAADEKPAATATDAVEDSEPVEKPAEKPAAGTDAVTDEKPSAAGTDAVTDGESAEKPDEKLSAAYAAIEKRRAERRAELPLIFAVVAMCLNFLFGAGILFGVPAVVFGALDLKRAPRSQRALWAVALGGVAILFGAAFLTCTIVLV